MNEKETEIIFFPSLIFSCHYSGINKKESILNDF